MEKPQGKSRIQEVDALRGLAVAGMIVYHGIWIANDVGLSRVDLSLPWIEGLATLGRVLFLGLVGVSIVLSTRSMKGQGWRALKVLGVAELLSLGSWLLFPEQWVRFGVLHCIAVSILVTRALKARPLLAGVLGAGLILMTQHAELMGAVRAFFEAQAGHVFWDGLGVLVGFPPFAFVSMDYFPLIPWLGVPLLGLVVGHKVYAQGRNFRLSFLARIPWILGLGQHAFAIYFLHLPLLYISLWGLSLLFKSWA